MTNIWIICQKELKSYFASPIAYLLMAFFALIFGFGFFTATRDFVRFGFQAEMQGRSMPMNVNEQVIRPLLGFASTVALFLIPMITMRLFAEEKKTGTIELLMTSPVRDWEIILGKWLGALLLYMCVLAMSAINIAVLEADSDRLPGADPARRHLAGRGSVHLDHHQESDYCRRRHLLCMPAAVAAELVYRLRQHRLRVCSELPVHRDAL
jgi:hypothetical protein